MQNAHQPGTVTQQSTFPAEQPMAGFSRGVSPAVTPPPAAISGYTPEFEQPVLNSANTKWMLGFAVGATLLAAFGLIRAMSGSSTPAKATAAPAAVFEPNEQMKMAREMMNMAKEAQAMQKERMEMMRKQMEMAEEGPGSMGQPGGE